jgi:hypothetical protein
VFVVEIEQSGIVKAVLAVEEAGVRSLVRDRVAAASRCGQSLLALSPIVQRRNGRDGVTTEESANT